MNEEDSTEDIEYLRSFIRELRDCNKKLNAELEVRQKATDQLLFQIVRLLNCHIYDQNNDCERQLFERVLEAASELHNGGDDNE